MKRFLRWFGTAFLIVAIVLLGWKVKSDFTYFEGYEPGLPFHAREESREQHPDYERVKLYFESSPGEIVPTLLTLPLERTGPAPCVVFLHGIGQEKEFLDEITGPFNRAGFAMACFDQHMQGERKVHRREGALKLGHAFYRRAAMTVNDTRRLIDYLQSRDEIDGERIYLVGASYGAITGTTAAAFDPRIRATVLVYGGGNIFKMLEASAIKPEIGAWLPLVKAITWFFMWPADPVRHAGKIAPRPVLLQNGKEDELIAYDAAVALQDAVNEPKFITWYEGRHINPDDDPATVQRVLAEGLNWLIDQDRAVQTAASPAAARGGLAAAGRLAHGTE